MNNRRDVRDPSYTSKKLTYLQNQLEVVAVVVVELRPFLGCNKVEYFQIRGERERAGKHRTESLSPAGGGGGPP